jgi:hypothetical protein
MLFLAESLAPQGFPAGRLVKRGYRPWTAKCWHPQTITGITKRSWDRALQGSARL